MDADRLEACAAELLRPKYGSLRWLPGPNDAGQDGLGETLEGTEFLFVVTTAENVTRNLRNSLTSYRNAGGGRHAVVPATSRVVSGRIQQELPAKIKAEFGIELLEIHDREAIVELLADHLEWRKELLGLTSGPVGALTRQFQRDHADLASGLSGRDDGLQALSTARGDLIVAGLPGVGKSFLLDHLCLNHDWGWPVRDHDHSIPEPADEILEEKSARIIVDDAHFDAHLVSGLDQLRREIGHSFDIVACCWESGTDEVAEGMPAARVVHIPQLERTHIGALPGTAANRMNNGTAPHTALNVAALRPPTARQLARWKAVQQPQLQGLSMRATARLLGISRVTVSNCVRANGVPGRRNSPAPSLPERIDSDGIAALRQ